MVTEHGTTDEPGIVTDVNSSLSVSSSGEAPADVGIVGQANLTEGSASPNKVYEVRRATEAQDWFGKDSLLTNAVLDALSEGAFPVYTVATEMISVSDEDLSSLSSNTGSLSNEAVSENPADTVFTIGGSELDTVIEFGDNSSMNPGTGEVYLDPTTGDFSIDSGITIGNSGDSVSYEYADYPSANEALANDAGGAVDFFVPLNEAPSVKEDALTKIENMEAEYDLALGIFGASASLDVSNYSASFDDSRVQLIYPTRDTGGNSVLGSYAGLRASIGITTTPINKNLTTQKSLSERLARDERGILIDERVVPLAAEAEGARVADDVNTVSEDNSEESAIRYGFTRLVIDYVINTVRLNEQPYIGRLNSPAVRAALEGVLTNQLKTLTRSNAILDFEVSVTKIDATTAAVDITIDAAEPLRFIRNTITVGDQ